MARSNVRSILCFLVLFAACMPAPGEPPLNSPNSGGRTVYPPNPTSEHVDAYGGATDPEVGRCMRNMSTRQNVAGTVFGPSSVAPDRSLDFKMCWCRTHGHRGLGRNGACV